MFNKVRWIDQSRVDGTEEDEGRNLQETDLQGVSGTDLHRQRNIPIHRKRDCILSITTYISITHPSTHFQHN